MEREANYTIVGAFVLLVITIAGLFVYWYSDATGKRNYTRYEVYFDGSVAGLTEGASVRYLGVNVGRVVNLNIDRRNAGRVQVIVDVDSTTPVSTGTVAELSQQGVTGVLYIDLASQAGNRALQDVVPSERFPVIRSSRSNIDQLLANLPEMVGRATEALDRLQVLFDERNMQAFSGILANLNTTTAVMPQTVKDLDSLGLDLHSTSEEIARTAVSVRGITDGMGPQLRGVMDQMTEIARNLNSVTAGINSLIEENRASLRAFTRDGLPQAQQLMGNGQTAVGEVRDLAHSLRENPSQLLLEKPEQGVLIPP
jgi:phospholipid/cholesterol/gamma-HCH transport system substrate-binding protein